MDDNPQLLGRVERALGPPAATMFAERGRDRHFIFELTLSGVALYVLGKYLEGFIEGLGIKEVGKKHGQVVTAAVQYGLETFTEEQQPDKRELEQHAELVSRTVNDLGEYQSDPRALASGSTMLVLIFEDQGIPRAETERISKDIASAIWQP